MKKSKIKITSFGRIPKFTIDISKGFTKDDALKAAEYFRKGLSFMIIDKQ